MRLAFVTEYDGTNFSGFQKQKNAISVQESIEDALKDNDPKQYCEYPEFVFNSETDSFVKTDECLMRGW